ncbi:MAG: glycosyltransferase family 4 protein, partial [Chloroflexi bacterium]|nr:glycosyltransferase family 4 protein [Chloroflexota bacterium]
RDEGGPKAILEGMATGVPVVSTRVGMAPDVMLDGENGFIVDVEDADGLAKAASNLIDSPELRSRLAQNGLATAAEHDWSITAMRYYDQVWKPLLSN